MPLPLSRNQPGGIDMGGSPPPTSSAGPEPEASPSETRPGTAREIAAPIAALPPLTAIYTRLALTQKLRRVVDESVGYGLALEGLSAAAVAPSPVS